MIISEQWLRSWVNPALTTEALAEQLTMAGLEVDGVTPAAGEFSGVIVAEIVTAEQHPDADKLRVCEVSTGAATVQIVCGAPNARVGLKAPLAQVGAQLPGNLKIKKAKLRGLESQGMLCAQAELQISDENAGLMELPSDAPVGQDLRDYLQLNDALIEIGLTPNRADCLSIAGVARDVAALNSSDMCAPVIDPVPVATETSFAIEVKVPEKCPRYIGRVIDGVDLSLPTPVFIAERLRRAGLRSIDAAVDITNYVMLELGQPLHAFDLDTLSGGIVVRNANADETMTLLDGSDIALALDTLVIADHTRPLALAGIMGGENSGVTGATSRLFLESAFFTPRSLAGQARGYGLHTDASHRYERGVDPQLQQRAIERATQLLLDSVGGRAGPLTEVSSGAHLPEPQPIRLRASRITRVLGFAMDSERVEAILLGLGFHVTSDIPGEWACTAPSWRFDMEQEVDLIEELARIYGYNHLPISRIKGDVALAEQTESQRSIASVRRLLVSRGFQEAITYSFVSQDLQARFDPTIAPISLRNPISSDLSVMRTSLIPGLLAVAAHNAKRQSPRVRLFETGMCFFPGPTAEQRLQLGLMIMGPRTTEGWASVEQAVDFFDIKGEVEQLLTAATGAVSFRPVIRPGLHDGQTAEVLLDNAVVGLIAAIHPLTAEAMDLPAATMVAELSLDCVLAAQLPTYQDISRYPETRRDLAVVLDGAVPAETVLEVIHSAAGPQLVDLRVFDVYAGKGIEPGQKSLALGLTFRHQSRTLDEQEIASAMAQVIDSLEQKISAKLRS